LPLSENRIKMTKPTIETSVAQAQCGVAINLCMITCNLPNLELGINAGAAQWHWHDPKSRIFGQPSHALQTFPQNLISNSMAADAILETGPQECQPAGHKRRYIDTFVATSWLWRWPVIQAPDTRKQENISSNAPLTRTCTRLVHNISLCLLSSSSKK